MVIAVRAVLVTFFEHFGIFSEGLFALFADEGLVGGVLGLGLLWIWIMGILPCPSSAVAHGLQTRDGIRRNQTIFGLFNS